MRLFATRLVHDLDLGSFEGPQTCAARILGALGCNLGGLLEPIPIPIAMVFSRGAAGEGASSLRSLRARHRQPRFRLQAKLALRFELQCIRTIQTPAQEIEAKLRQSFHSGVQRSRTISPKRRSTRVPWSVSQVLLLIASGSNPSSSKIDRLART